MLKDSNVRISDPAINQVVFFKPWQGKNANRKKAYPVIINSGKYLSNGLLSNFWEWQRVSPTGRINNNIESGYGNFTVAWNYEVQRKIKVL